MENFNKLLEYVTDKKFLAGLALGFLVGTLLRCFDL